MFFFSNFHRFKRVGYFLRWIVWAIVSPEKVALHFGWSLFCYLCLVINLSRMPRQNIHLVNFADLSNIQIECNRFLFGVSLIRDKNPSGCVQWRIESKRIESLHGKCKILKCRHSLVILCIRRQLQFIRCWLKGHFDPNVAPGSYFESMYIQYLRAARLGPFFFLCFVVRTNTFRRWQITQHPMIPI